MTADESPIAATRDPVISGSVRRCYPATRTAGADFKTGACYSPAMPALVRALFPLLQTLIDSTALPT